MAPEILDKLIEFLGLMALFGIAGYVIKTRAWQPKVGPDPALARQLEEISERLARLEHTTDSTALEVERVGEAHRFLTKTLSERSSTKEP